MPQKLMWHGLTAQDLWNDLSRIPVDDSGATQHSFFGFCIGTQRGDIWRWLEELDPSFSVAEAMASSL